LALLVSPREAAAQLDPLLFLKRANTPANGQTGKPNVLIAVDTSLRMQRDTNGDYRDDNVYKYADPILAWETALGIIPGTHVAPAGTLRRKYVNLQFISSSGDKYSADRIEIVGDRQNPDYGLFDEYTRISIARRALIEAIKRNSSVVRFGLLRMRQNAPTY